MAEGSPGPAGCLQPGVEGAVWFEMHSRGSRHRQTDGLCAAEDVDGAGAEGVRSKVDRAQQPLQRDVAQRRSDVDLVRTKDACGVLVLL